MKAVLSLVALALFLTACTGLLRLPGKSIALQDVHKGSEGIATGFAQGSPPKDFFEDGVFNAIVFVENKGASDISNGIYVFSVEDQYIELLKDSVGRFDLKGRSVYSPVGEKKFFTFKGKARLLGKQTERITTTMLFSICYPYTTEATASVCVDTDILNLNARKPCTPKAVALSGGQGAPVAVTKVETKMIPGDIEGVVVPQLIIYIKNVGKGQIIDAAKAKDLCIGQRVLRDDFNTVAVKAFLGEEALECRKDEIKVDRDENRVVCILPEGFAKDLGTYTTILRVELDYGYTSNVAAQSVILSTKSAR